MSRFEGGPGVVFWPHPIGMKWRAAQPKAEGRQAATIVDTLPVATAATCAPWSVAFWSA